MFILDTDTLTHMLLGRKRVIEKWAQASMEVTLTIVTRIEVLQGRFASILKAEDGDKLVLAQRRLVDNENDLKSFIIHSFDTAASTQFDRLRQNKKLRISRTDLLIAAITLAHRAILVTRNEKDFRKVPGLRVENWCD